MLKNATKEQLIHHQLAFLAQLKVQLYSNASLGN
jgi:hypothetical protein